VLLVCVGLACSALAALPAGAMATAPEMRGEWSVLLTSGGQTVVAGKTVISQEPNVKGEFISQTVFFEDGGTGSFSGTLEGGKATVKLIANPEKGFPEGQFNSPPGGMTVETVGALTISGEGTIKVLTNEAKGTFTATKIKTYKEVEEREAREKLELEEREARGNVRGEWSLTIEAGPQVAKGVAIIGEEASSENRFASASALFEGIVPSTFSGKLEGGEASVTVTTAATGPIPASTFTATKIVVTSASNPTSMTGAGTLTAEKNSYPATFTATRVKTHQEVLEREQQEREAREAVEKAEREAKEKQEREAKEKQEREAREREALAAKEREVKERQEREAAEKAAAKTSSNGPGNPALVAVRLAGKTFTVSSGLLSLQIRNPNPYAISGRVTLLAAKSRHKAAKASSLGTASFGVAADGEQLVKLKLSQSGRTELAHHKILHALATITTEASGQPATTKTFSLTLHTAKPRSKH
jgi:hypothetical protein